MASQKKQKNMVLRQDDPRGHPPPVGSNATGVERGYRGQMEQGTHRTSEDSDTQDSMSPSEDAISRPGGLKHPAALSSPGDTLSPESLCKGIRVTLDNNLTWNEFSRCQTEMIVTSQGSRMFPYCRFRISGLKPSKKYALIMDIQPLDNSQYWWTGKSWQVAGKAECHVGSPPFVHQESPATGQHWMQSPVSFFRLKLTNNLSDLEGHTVLRPMHRYLPRLHVVPTDKAANDTRLNSPSVVTFTFPQTEFMAVTTYQNLQFAKLKFHCNPFSKGLKEDGLGSRGLKLKTSSIKDPNVDGHTTNTEQHSVRKSLMSLLANHKPKTSKVPESKPSSLEDLHRQNHPGKDPSVDKVPEDSSRGASRPAPKLFSELIREAHVSLHRCNLEELCVNQENSVQAERPQTARGQEVIQRDRVSTKGPAMTLESAATKGDGTVEGELSVKVMNCQNNIRTESPAAGPKGSQNSLKDSNHHHSWSEASVREHKRPARLPLPALALFLKQHSTKSKKIKPDSPYTALPSEPSPLRPPAESGSLPSHLLDSVKGPLKDLYAEASKLDHQVPRGYSSDQKDLIVSPIVGTLSICAADSDINDTRTNLVCERLSPGPMVLDGSSMLHSSEQVFNTRRSSLKPLSSSFTALSACSSSSSPCHTVFTAPDSPHTSTRSSSDSGGLKAESVLPDPGCSSFGFDTLSPASSPELLPPLPASLSFHLHSTGSEAAQAAGPPEESPDTIESSVFKWHTVLPPLQPFIDSPFTTFQPALQTLSLLSGTASDPDSPSLDSSAPPPGPSLSFQESDQSLPFPAELSPLALQLPLSPTFSSLDEGGLSPTPSLADLVHFFSTNDDLGMEFSNPLTASPYTPQPTVTAQEAESALSTKTCRHKLKSHRRKPANVDKDQAVDEVMYRSMQPNLEEVEEQLFVSFTSKEALKLHIMDSAGLVPQILTPEDHPTPQEPQNAESQTIGQVQEGLLRDLKLMRHRQVIHPVLQEVGLKMNLLDPTLAIDLQYLGVRLPLPPPGVRLEPACEELPPAEALGFVSRTGKTTDVTQIKGWRDKFSGPEGPHPAANLPPEAAGSSSEPQKKKNLSAFCSDMLDEYLENEGRLIDERAASFSQPPVEPPVYELPTRSTSYVRTLDHVLKKSGDPTSDLISQFIPPSKRPRAPEAKTGRRKPRTLKPKLIFEQATAVGPESSPAEPVVPTTDLSASEPATNRKRRRFKPRAAALPPGLSEDLAPLESDSELAPEVQRSKEASRRAGGPPMTRALLRQRDLEEAARWQGRSRTSITEERASVALTSLFTLTGFVSEDPSAPVQLRLRRPAVCLNDFCRLGCVCNSLSYSCRLQHCGRSACMFGCSCLKQKVVLLKNLDGSDCSPPTPHAGPRRRRRRRRMKMAYVLKEAESVSQPAERVRALWTRDAVDPDPEPLRVPARPPMSRFMAPLEKDSSCARVRGYHGNKLKGATNHTEQQTARLKRNKLKETRTSGAPPSTTPPPSPPEDPPMPSKRLSIKADCQWASDGERTFVLKRLCEALAWDQLDRPFWIKKYLISPAGTSIEGRGPEAFVHYKVHISKPNLDRQKPATAKPRSEGPGAVGPSPGEAVAVGAGASGGRRRVEQSAVIQDVLTAVCQRKKPQEVKMEPVEDWQKEVEEGDLKEEEEPLEDWQKEVEEGDLKEEEEEEVPDVPECSREAALDLALPLLTGISPAGFLSACLKRPGGSTQLVQVNGKLYPLARIQLGMMGALHPANRLAAYLTGRVGSARALPAAPSSSGRGPSSDGPRFRAPLTPVHLPHFPHATSSLIPVPLPLCPSGTSPLTPVPRPGLLPILQGGATLRLSNSEPSPAPPTGSQLVMIQVQGPRSQAAPPPPAHRFVLQPVQTASGAQYYRRPDGKLVQLIVNRVKPLTHNTPSQRGPSVLSTASSQPAGSTVVSHSTPRPTPLKMPSSTSSPTSTNQLQSWTLFPVGSSRSVPVVTCCTASSHPARVAVPLDPPSFPPTPSVHLLPSASPAAQGAEGEITAVTVLQDPGSDHHTPSSPTETCDLHPRPRAVPAPACDPSDVDIVCVDEPELVTTTTQLEDRQLLSGSDMYSSESRESDGEEEQEEEGEEEGGSKKQLPSHTLLERRRRLQLHHLLHRLRRHVGLADEKTPQLCTLKRAQQVIQELHLTEEALQEEKKKLMWSLMRRREQHLALMVPPAEGAEPRREPVVASSDEEGVVITETDEEHRASNQLPAGGGASCCPPANTSNDDITATSPAPPAPPTLPAMQPQRVSLPSHNAPVQKCQRTIPIILSRSRTSCPKPLACPPASFLVPADVLSFVGTALPGQPVLTVTPLMAGPSPTPGGASVTPNLTNQQLHLTAACHQTATERNNLQHQYQAPCPPAPPPSAPPAATPVLLGSPPLLVSGGPENPGPMRTALSPQRSNQSLRTECQEQIQLESLQRVLVAPQGTCEGGETVTSLLSELVVLNQRTAVTPPIVSVASVGGANDVGGVCSPRSPQLDSDGPVAMVKAREGLNRRTQIGLTNENIKGGVLAPPPLLQMKVGGATMTEPPNGDEVEGEGGEGGVSWRPMPRLVPLGLRGNPPPD